MPARGPVYTPDESAAIARAWVQTSEDPNRDDMSVDEFNKTMKRIVVELTPADAREDTYGARPDKAIVAQKRKISDDVTKFMSCLERVQAARLGLDIQEEINIAVHLHRGRAEEISAEHRYQDPTKWNYYESYKILRGSPKFNSLNEPKQKDPQPTTTKKQKRAAAPAASIVAADENLPDHANLPPPPTNADILKSILDAVDSDETLCSLPDIKSGRAWDFSMPTLTRPGLAFTPRNTYTSDAPLFQSIQQHNQGLTHSLLKAVGALHDESEEQQSIVLYGGALVDIIMKREHKIKDWNLRLVGEEYAGSQEKCLEAARKFVDAVLQWIREENGKITIRNEAKKIEEDTDEPIMNMEKFTVSRSKSTLTLTVPTKGIKLHDEVGSRQRTCPRDTVLQFTFTPSNDVHELFSVSRPYCTRIAIWDGKVVLAPIARYCLESCCIVLDKKSMMHCNLPAKGGSHTSGGPLTRSMPLELRRSVQYFSEKGFDVILPDLDMAKVPRRNLKFGIKEVLDLPLLTVIFTEIQGFKIVVDKMKVRSVPLSIVDEDGDMGEETDEEPTGGYDSPVDLNVDSVIHHNLKCLIAGIYDRFQFFTEGEVVDPVFDFCPELTPRMVQLAFRTVRSRFEDATDLFPIPVVLQYFRATPPNQVFERLVLKPAGDFIKDGGDPTYLFKLDKKILKDLIDLEEQDVIRNKLPSMRDRIVDSALDKFSLEIPAEVSSEYEIASALYGKYVKM